MAVFVEQQSLRTPGPDLAFLIRIGVVQAEDEGAFCALPVETERVWATAGRVERVGPQGINRNRPGAAIRAVGNAVKSPHRRVETLEP